MPLATISDLLDDVIDEIPGKEQAPVIRALNRVLRRLYTDLVEPQRGTFTTAAEVTTGTVAVTQGSTTATFSSGVLSASDPLRLVQIAGEATWFGVTRNSADTAGVLSSAWAEATDSAATYSIVYPTVAFPSVVGEILSIRRYGYGGLEFRAHGRCPSHSGTPVAWSPYSHDETASDPDNDKTRIWLDPAPNDRLVYEYWYKPRTAKIAVGAATSTTIPLSDLWYEAMVEGVLYQCWKHESPSDRAMIHLNLYEKALREARGAALPGAVIMPRTGRRGGFTFEDRPIAGA